MATMFMAAKLAAQSGVRLPEIMFWRQAACVPMLLGWLAATGGLGRLRTRRLGAHIARAGIGTTGMALNFAGAILLALPEFTTLNFTAPLFAVIIAALVLGERVGVWRWGAVACGFAGVVVIAGPGRLDLPVLGAAAGLGSALFNAITSFQIRDLTRSEQPVCVVFYFALFGSLLTAGLLPFYSGAHSVAQWALLIGMGMIGGIGQLFMTAALRLGTVASVIVMDYSAIIWAVLYGRLIWGQMPSATLWAGAPLIVTAGLVIAAREHRLARARAANV